MYGGVNGCWATEAAVSASWAVDDLEAIILDRDGVINENRSDHVKCWDEFEFLPGAMTAIANLRRAGLRVFVITNQAIINRGLASRDTVDELNGRMIDAIERSGGRVEAVAYCPHRPDECCQCRKPKPGLLIDIATRFGVDLSRSVVVGDALSDVEAGLAVGCKTILVLTGRGRQQMAQGVGVIPREVAIAPDLCAVSEWLLAQRTAAKQLETGVN
jgi:D-glycero-D-manno-heptose 1,7-bisphosphate phosphatase